MSRTVGQTPKGLDGLGPPIIPGPRFARCAVVHFASYLTETAECAVSRLGRIVSELVAPVLGDTAHGPYCASAAHVGATNHRRVPRRPSATPSPPPKTHSSAIHAWLRCGAP